MHDAILQRIQPIVLVGGQSRRFGRDKLREPVGVDGGRWLVDIAIAALRDVFGRRVAMVGNCHPDVAARGDFVIDDEYPGAGPAGGILSALNACASQDEPLDVFVLAGDLPRITSATVRRIVDRLAVLDSEPVSVAHDAREREHIRPRVILGEANGVQPCIGLYRQTVRSVLAERVVHGRGSLHDLVDSKWRALVAIDERESTNANTPDEISN